MNEATRGPPRADRVLRRAGRLLAAAVTVPQKDMVMRRLSLGALLRKAREEMGLVRGEKPRGLPKGVLWVGEMSVEGGVVRFFYVVRAVDRREGADRDRPRDHARRGLRASGGARAQGAEARARLRGDRAERAASSSARRAGGARWARRCGRWASRTRSGVEHLAPAGCAARRRHEGRAGAARRSAARDARGERVPAAEVPRGAAGQGVHEWCRRGDGQGDQRGEADVGGDTDSRVQDARVDDGRASRRRGRTCRRT